MKTIPRTSLILVLLAVSALPAQGPGRIAPRRPTVSPYLNLLRNDGNEAVNYYGIVKPQKEFRDASNALENENRLLKGQVDQQASALQQSTFSQLRPTGHQAGFNSHARFFFTNSSASGSTNASAGGGIPGR